MFFKPKTMKLTEPTFVTFQIGKMHCSSCAINIDFELEDLEGVKEAKTHYAKQQSVVSFDPEKVTHKQMIAVITKLGYEAVIITEDEKNN